MLGVIEFFCSKNPRYSWNKALWILLLSTLSISGTAFLIYFSLRYSKQRQMLYADGVIKVIVQTPAQGSISLSTPYLAEVLDLSVDQPTSLENFDVNKARSTLLGTHIIKEVNVKKMKPDVLFIQYTVRTPLVLAGDYANTALDTEGTLFPYSPFFAPKFLPSLYLNNVGSRWGQKIPKEPLEVVKSIFSVLGPDLIHSIDLSHIHSTSAGRRELIIALKQGCILRLSPEDYMRQLTDYSILKTTLPHKPPATIIDLRIPDIAFVVH